MQCFNLGAAHAPWLKTGQKLRKKLLATIKENIDLKQKLNDIFEEILEIDEDLTSLTQKYETTVPILGNSEQG